MMLGACWAHVFSLVQLGAVRILSALHTTVASPFFIELLEEREVRID